MVPPMQILLLARRLWRGEDVPFLHKKVQGRLSVLGPHDAALLGVHILQRLKWSETTTIGT